MNLSNTLLNNQISQLSLKSNDFKLSLGNVVSIAMPTFLLAIALATMIWFFVEVKRKRLQLKIMIVWFILNTLYTIMILYVFIVTILQIFNFPAFNIFTLFSYYVLGLELPNNMGWVFLLIFGFITYVLIKSMLNSLRIARLDDRIDDLNQEVAILRGKINETAEFKHLPLPATTPSPKEIKFKIKSKLRNIRAELKAEKKLHHLKQKYQQNTQETLQSTRNNNQKLNLNLKNKVKSDVDDEIANESKKDFEKTSKSES